MEYAISELGFSDYQTILDFDYLSHYLAIFLYKYRFSPFRLSQTNWKISDPLCRINIVFNHVVSIEV
jgi:hypothetical protein